MEKLSKKQQRVYDYVRKYIEENNMPPTIREIGDACGLASTSTVHSHLATLEKKGYIIRKKSKNRCMEITENGFYKKGTKKVPVLGAITPGTPIFDEKNIEGYFPVASQFCHDNDSFMLRIKDDSMKDAGIISDDLVLVRKQSYADHNDIVIAVVDNAPVCRRFLREKNSLVLRSENDSLRPLFLNDVMILGKVTGLFREFS